MAQSRELSIVKNVYKNGKKLQKIVLYLGTANKLLEKLKRLEQLEKRIKSS